MTNQNDGTQIKLALELSYEDVCPNNLGSVHCLHIPQNVQHPLILPLAASGPQKQYLTEVEWVVHESKETVLTSFPVTMHFHQLVKGKRFMRLWTNNIITNIMTTHTVTCLVRKLFAFRRTANNHTSKIKENHLWKTLTLYFCFLLHFKTWSTLPWK